MKCERLDEFLSYLDREVSSAVSELNNVAEGSRQHLQKLVYTNIVDRFDSTIDHLLLENVLEEPLLSETLKELEKPISEGQLLGLLSSSSKVNEYILERTQTILRNGILRQRHSVKLKKFFETFVTNEDYSKPRVNPSTGLLAPNFKPQRNVKIPCSIAGYADWLYSRRNAIVHGGGSVKMLQNDIEQIKKLYKRDVAKTVRLKIGSITNAVQFYRNLTSLINKNKSSYETPRP